MVTDGIKASGLTVVSSGGVELTVDTLRKYIASVRVQPKSPLRAAGVAIDSVETLDNGRMCLVTTCNGSGSFMDVEQLSNYASVVHNASVVIAELESQLNSL